MYDLVAVQVETLSLKNRTLQLFAVAAVVTAVCFTSIFWEQTRGKSERKPMEFRTGLHPSLCNLLQTANRKVTQLVPRRYFPVFCPNLLHVKSVVSDHHCTSLHIIASIEFAAHERPASKRPSAALALHRAAMSKPQKPRNCAASLCEVLRRCLLGLFFF